jgi:hypothetical protein
MPQAFIVFSINPVPPTAAARYKKSRLLIIDILPKVVLSSISNRRANALQMNSSERLKNKLATWAE